MELVVVERSRWLRAFWEQVAVSSNCCRRNRWEQRGRHGRKGQGDGICDPARLERVAHCDVGIWTKSSPQRRVAKRERKQPEIKALPNQNPLKKTDEKGRVSQWGVLGG
jgi:hypothetical protein